MPSARKNSITVASDRELLKRARAVAAKRGCSVSALLASELRELVASDQKYDAAQRRARGLMAVGLALGGTKLTNRDAIHQRHHLR